MAGYTRQAAASFVTGGTMTAAIFNAEYNAIESAFNGASGHAHDGTTGNAPKISLTAAVSGTLPIANGGTGATSAANARAALDLEPGVDVLAYNAALQAMSSITPTDSVFIVGNGTAFIGESGSTARTSLGLGSLATQNSNSITVTGGTIAGITDLAVADGGTGASDASGARTNLGLVIGTDVQAFGARLDDVAGLTPTDGIFIVGNGTNFVGESGSTARTSLGLGSMATQNSNGVTITGGTLDGVNITNSTIGSGGVIGIDGGGTGATIAADARNNLGLEIGVDIMGYDALLASVAGLTFTTDNYIYGTGADTAAVGTITGFGRSIAAVADAAATRTLIGLGTAATAGDASTSAKGIVELATDAETQTGTDTARAITPANLTAKEASVSNFRGNATDRLLTTDIVWGSAEEVSLTDAATIAVDMSTFINAKVTLGGNRTLGSPSNLKVGQCGFIRIIQDGTGNRTLAYHGDWKFLNGIDPTLSTAGNATDILFYHVIASGFVFASLVKSVA